MNEPRDERNIKAEVEVSTSRFLPVGFRFKTSFERIWNKRVEDYRDTTAKLAGVDIDELETTVDTGGAFADLFLEGARRVTGSGDEVLRDTVTRLVAAALRDDALIQDTSYLMNKLSGCEVLHVRAIRAIPERELSHRPFGPFGDKLPKGELVLANIRWLEEAAEYSTSGIASKCRASKSLTLAAIGELEAIGFARSITISDDLERVRANFYPDPKDSKRFKNVRKMTQDSMDPHEHFRLIFKETGISQEHIERSLHTASRSRYFGLTDLGKDLRRIIQEIDSANEEHAT